MFSVYTNRTYLHGYHNFITVTMEIFKVYNRVLLHVENYRQICSTGMFNFIVRNDTKHPLYPDTFL